ncbi:hypothetical protein [Flaviaesturariibacter amylovorans]|uniref:T9SS type A sorting domain-containing protein n=1 Tax=Flaviaesturariibacter amylovorans TaxID=1084520 RepID=A0ABP8GS21_9BACT
MTDPLLHQEPADRSGHETAAAPLLSDDDPLLFYPFPVIADSPCIFALNASAAIKGEIEVSISDACGTLILSRKLNRANNVAVRLNDGLGRGSYQITIVQGRETIIRRLAVC